MPDHRRQPEPRDDPDAPAAGRPEQRIAGLGARRRRLPLEAIPLPELVLRVRALARRQPRTQKRILHTAGVELDPATGAVTRNGHAIALSAKERAVLEALLNAHPAGLSAELLEQAWDENVDPFTNTVRVTIARLRRRTARGNPDHPGNWLPHHRNALTGHDRRSATDSTP